jgi:uncharacterized protein DUF5412
MSMKRLTVTFIFLLLATACADPCANTVVREVTSPDGRYTATAFIRDCGATTSYSPQVYLRRAGESAGTTGNVFVGNRSDEIEISWASAKELVISSSCQVVRREEEHEGIKITFNPLR